MLNSFQSIQIGGKSQKNYRSMLNMKSLRLHWSWSNKGLLQQNNRIIKTKFKPNQIKIMCIRARLQIKFTTLEIIDYM